MGIHAIDTVLEPVGNIVEVAKSNDDFSTLVEALTRVNLTDTLSGEGPYTVFAPTNAAFEEYLDGVSIDKVDVDSLTNILLTHVLSGKIEKLDLLDSDTVTALNENDISISAFFKWWKISSKKKTKQFEQHIDVFLNDDTEVTAFDIMASNGIIHVIDRVLKPADNIIEVAKSNDDFSILVEALTRVNLTDTLSGDGDFTVFAPTNAAFEEYLDGASIDKVDVESLTQILLYHVLPVKVKKSDLLDTDTVTTVKNNDISVSAWFKWWKWAYQVFLNDNTEVTAFDIMASNG